MRKFEVEKYTLKVSMVAMHCMSISRTIGRVGARGLWSNHV